MSEFRPNALIAAGGNQRLGEIDPTQALIGAVKNLATRDVSIRGVSRFFKTPCFPVGTGPDYVNAALSVETGLSADALLALLHEVEHAFGRQRNQRWGQRTLDLDLIGYGAMVAPDPVSYRRWHDLGIDDQRVMTPSELILPHPRMQDRAFVLVPLCDIAPDWCHPVLGSTVAQMCAALPEDDRAAVVPI